MKKPPIVKESYTVEESDLIFAPALKVQDKIWAVHIKYGCNSRDHIRIPPREVIAWVKDGASEAIRCQRAMDMMWALEYPTVVWYRDPNKVVPGCISGPSLVEDADSFRHP